MRANETRVGRGQSRNQSSQLGEGYREPGQREHGQQHISGIKVGGQTTLRLPAQDSLDRLSGCLQPTFLVDEPPLAELQCFPFKQADPILILASKIEPIGQTFPGIVGCGNSPGLSLLDFTPQHFPEERLLIAKIMVEHPLIDRGTLRNAINPRARKPFRGKFLKSGLQNSFLRPFWITRSWPTDRDRFQTLLQLAKKIDVIK